MRHLSKTLVALAVAGFGSGSALAADTFLTNVSCTFNDLVGVTVSACTGFYSGNLLRTDAPGPTDGEGYETAALNALLGGSATSYDVLQKIPDTAGNPADFTTLLYGLTVIGVHFGEGADRWPADYTGSGGGTAFYLFDAGTDGLDWVTFADDLAGASSGATLYRTGDMPFAVPEPSTYALILAGLVAVGLKARRRREASESGD